jgi:hypothetical protein
MSSNMLPKSSVPPLFGHMFLQHVTEIFSSYRFRADVPPTCYRNLQLLPFSGRCSTNMLPKSSAPPLFGHMFRPHVTEILSSSPFRAQVSPTCYRNLQLLPFSGTGFSNMLPKSSAPPLFGQMFLVYATEITVS